MAPQTQVREVRVVVDTKNASGLKEVAEGFKRVNGSIKETNSLLSNFQKIFLSIQGFRFAGIGISELTNASDTYQKLSDRIKVFEGSQEKANQTMEGLAQVADKTRSSIEGVATIYSRLSLALNETKLTSGDLLFITEQLTNSFRLSGSTAAEATAATIQLSQGLASGTLRGQELRSVLESNALIGQLLSEELNTTRGQLMKMAEAGKITSDVFLKALANGSVKLNKDVESLGVTFKEATDKGLNKFNIAIGQMNKEFGVSSKYDKTIGFLVDNISLLGAVAAAAAVFAIPALITSLNNLSIAMYLFATTNPLLLLLTALVGVITYAYLEFDKFSELVLKGREYFKIFAATVGEEIFKLVKAILTFGGIFEGGFLTSIAEDAIGGFQRLREEAVKDLKAIDKASDAIKRGNDAVNNLGVKDFDSQLAGFKKTLSGLGNLGAAEKLKSIQVQIKELNASFEDGKISVETYNRRIVELSTELYKKKGPIPLADQLDKLQKENLQRLFEYGKIGAEEFRDSLNKIEVDQLNKKFERGRITQTEYLKEAEKLRNKVYELNKELRDVALVNYNKELAQGSISLMEYKFATQELAIEELNDKFKSGQIDIYNYNKALVETSDKFLPGSALSVGLQNYITSAGTLSQNVANAITQTFGNLENYMTEFLKNGKFQFKDFANAVIEDLNRIIIRSLIIRPLAEGILGSFSSGQGQAAPQGTAAVNYTGSSSSNVAAHGAAFDGMSSNFYAAGGVVTGRTGFNYGNGSKGVMGEKGPEAILPLARTSGGELGVVAAGSGGGTIVNIYNQGDSQVEQKTSENSNGEKVIDIIITKKIKEAFANGSLDKQMVMNYGLKRKGS